MNHRVLLILAVIFGLAALGVAWYGLQLSNQAPPRVTETGQAEEIPTVKVVKAALALPVGRAIALEDLRVVEIEEPQRPDGAYRTPDNLVGRFPRQEVAEGEILKESHLLNAGSIAQSLLPGERGVAVSVDETAGAGGFVEPEDYVDVLLYLRGGFEKVKDSEAQVVLRQVRVLAYGDEVLAEPDQELAETPDSEEDESDRVTSAKRSKTAVLAVPDMHTTRLMLAANAGSLRLAVYAASEGPLVAEDAEALVPLDELLGVRTDVPGEDMNGMAAPMSEVALAAAAEKERQRREKEARNRVRLPEIAVTEEKREPRRRGTRRAPQPQVVVIQGDELQRVNR